MEQRTSLNWFRCGPKTINMNHFSHNRFVRFFCFLLTIGISHHSFGQFQKIINYSKENGLLGNYGFGAFIDKQGYTWISTENGLLRYNGYSFKLFSTRDGLPDNEVFALQEDGEGRIWVVPFANSVAFIKDEVVHNEENDSLLAKLNIQSRPDRILCDREGNVVISERKVLTFISKEKVISKVKLGNKSTYFIIFKSEDDAINICFNNLVYKYINKHLVFQKRLPYINLLEPAYSHLLNSLGTERVAEFLNKTYSSPIKPFFQGMSAYETNVIRKIDTNVIAICRNDGCFLVNMSTAQVIDTLLFGTKVGDCNISKDGTLWVGTHGKGLFRYIKTSIKSLDLGTENQSVTHLRNDGNRMLIVFADGRVSAARFNKDGKVNQERILNLPSLSSMGPYTYVNTAIPNQVLLYGNSSLFCINTLTKKTDIIYAGCKGVFEESDGSHLLVPQFSGLIQINTKDLMIKNELLHNRTTSVAKMGNTIYAGTLNGLLANNFQHKEFKRIESAAPSLNRRITKLYPMYDSILWIANNHAELLALKDNKIVAQHGESNGFNCSRITVMKASGKYMWIGTNNGLYVLENKRPFSIISHLTMIAGLNSNQINAIDFNKDTVWVGTPEGINYFDQNDIFNNAPAPKLIVKSIINGTESLDLGLGNMNLKERTLRIGFDVIDYYSGQTPRYQYKFNNDTNWIELENSSIYFPTIPYGDFSVRIRANLPNWKAPEEKTILFFHNYPFYLKWWFVLSSIILIVIVLVLGSAFFVRKEREKDKVKINTQRNLLNLEQTALQTQMNPHFIFNCLVAIKQYYNVGNTEKANEFVDSLASLIRQAFEVGSETAITLEQELKYLSQYLLIEQKRFNHSFNYNVSVHIEQSAKAILVPTMILQPIVENAVRHGVRNLFDRVGEININVSEENNYISVVIKDNGVGRKKSAEYGQMFQMIKHVTSNTVTLKRIDILNKLYNDQINLITEDILNEQAEIVGTKVTLSYPVSIFDNQTKSEL